LKLSVPAADHHMTERSDTPSHMYLHCSNSLKADLFSIRSGSEQRHQSSYYPSSWKCKRVHL